MLTLAACKRTRDEISSFRGNRDSSPPPPTFPTVEIFESRIFDNASVFSIENLSILSRSIRIKFKASGYVQLSLEFASSIMHGRKLQPFATLETVDRYCMEIEKRIRRN